MNQYQERVVAGIYKYYAEELHIYPDDNGILDIEVSYDGSWMTRGHKSKIGAAFVIDCFTGSVVDYLVLSSYCGTCTVLSRKKISSDERKKLKEKHQSKCKVNYTGSSGGMEKEAAVTLWKRSVDLKLRYMVMVSDGDASTFKSLIEINNKEGPYGTDHKIIKEECKNHLHKRVASRLFSLKRSMREKKETATGKVLVLTDATIKTLQWYYLVAVNRHIGGNWKDLKVDIMSPFFHCTSTDSNPRHGLCSENWCFYKQDIKAQVPIRSHKNMEVAISSSETLEVQKVFEGKRSTPRPAKKRKRTTTKEEHYKSGDF
ncbi:hypothetical protein Pcinc_003549 [Petrolisthes cinctipes]|uniref:Mutator-like transposase domain-containing protein n=1 Tax=Petrolisthes cinctipes TaxID=88211 RepID=A0AAE1G7U2_PETCI|nr:hypothetical protein Pcinc_008235 [Petrolisthes cinctipes]KAK3892572.1 hypothetical protein Pcinc_003549 [Petrolisthes cinctipes]